MEGTGGEGGFQFWWILNPALQKGLRPLAKAASLSSWILATFSSQTPPSPVKQSHPPGTNSGAQVCPVRSCLTGLKTPNLRKTI